VTSGDIHRARTRFRGDSVRARGGRGHSGIAPRLVGYSQGTSSDSATCHGCAPFGRPITAVGSWDCGSGAVRLPDCSGLLFEPGAASVQADM
jgi:hypothetical protein